MSKNVSSVKHTQINNSNQPNIEEDNAGALMLGNLDYQQ